MKKPNRRSFLGNSVQLASGVLMASAFTNIFADSSKYPQAKSSKAYQNTLNKSQEATRNVAKNPFGLVYENAISKNEKGFVLVVEAGKIDWAGHAHDAGAWFHEMKALDELLGYLTAYADKNGETLVYLNADHDTGFCSNNGDIYVLSFSGNQDF